MELETIRIDRLPSPLWPHEDDRYCSGCGRIVPKDVWKQGKRHELEIYGKTEISLFCLKGMRIFTFEVRATP